ncbi:hypothetical protein Q3V37_18490 [Micromonospora profundi]|uniref:Uncharacterized protein n=1 Tax=Micromonospora profundi TaxID=1420889 RepID=A0AAJ6KXD4_9ACTN|nr:hypothetical protein [Micromonospora profundi]WLS43394.1 hypothetical protein Q3V37_18490 [Micromonospora profundi]
MTDTGLHGEDRHGAEDSSTGSRHEDLEDPWYGIPATLLDGPGYHIGGPPGEWRDAQETRGKSRAENVEDPWRGIPATLLDGPFYDADPAGDSR